MYVCVGVIVHGFVCGITCMFVSKCSYHCVSMSLCACLSVLIMGVFVYNVLVGLCLSPFVSLNVCMCACVGACVFVLVCL